MKKEINKNYYSQLEYHINKMAKTFYRCGIYNPFVVMNIGMSQNAKELKQIYQKTSDHYQSEHYRVFGVDKLNGANLNLEEIKQNFNYDINISLDSREFINKSALQVELILNSERELHNYFPYKIHALFYDLKNENYNIDDFNILIDKHIHKGGIVVLYNYDIFDKLKIENKFKKYNILDESEDTVLNKIIVFERQ